MNAPDGWAVESRLADGMQGGAWRVMGASGPAVLKWINVEPDDAYAVSEHARARGYPTPRWLDFGTTDDGRAWCVQELVDGEPMRDLDVAGAHLITELVAMQRTITPPTDRCWTTFGSADELVHGDLSVANVLLRDGVVAGVIDFDEASRGCAVADLLAPAGNAIIWHSDPVAIDVLHRCMREHYAADVIAAGVAVVAGHLRDWYSKASPNEFSRIDRGLTEWERSLQ